MSATLKKNEISISAIKRKINCHGLQLDSGHTVFLWIEPQCWYWIKCLFSLQPQCSNGNTSLHL